MGANKKTQAAGACLAMRRPWRTGNMGDTIARVIAVGLGLSVLALAGLLIYELIDKSWQSITEFGPGFITSTTWDPVAREFGAAPAIYGTIISSLIALVLAVPVSLGAAIFLSAEHAAGLGATGGGHEHRGKGAEHRREQPLVFLCRESVWAHGKQPEVERAAPHAPGRPGTHAGTVCRARERMAAHAVRLRSGQHHRRVERPLFRIPGRSLWRRHRVGRGDRG